MSVLISPSVLTADFLNLKEDIEKLEKSGADMLHLDVMDGNFVPNISFGIPVCDAIKKHTNIPLDIHLMVENPENKLSWFDIGEGDYVSVHYETTKHLQRTLAAIKATGAKAMVAINPATPLCVLDYVLDDIDAVLIMTVNPGYAGQKLIHATIEKIKQLRQPLDSKGYNNVEIEVDGNVNFPNAKLMRDAGANIFVAGSSSIFAKDDTVENNILKLREQIK